MNLLLLIPIFIIGVPIVGAIYQGDRHRARQA
jgi:hypothetical protein